MRGRMYCVCLQPTTYRISLELSIAAGRHNRCLVVVFLFVMYARLHHRSRTVEIVVVWYSACVVAKSTFRLKLVFLVVLFTVVLKSSYTEYRVKLEAILPRSPASPRLGICCRRRRTQAWRMAKSKATSEATALTRKHQLTTGLTGS